MLKWGRLTQRLIRGLCVIGLCEESNCEGNNEGWKADVMQSSAAARGSVMERAVWFSVQPEGDHFMQKHLGRLTFQISLIRSAKFVRPHLGISDNLL